MSLMALAFKILNDSRLNQHDKLDQHQEPQEIHRLDFSRVIN